MNPKTNKFESLISNQEETNPENRFREFHNMGAQYSTLLRPNGDPVPQHWTQFQVGEHVIIKNYTFKVAYINESTILFEPVGIPNIGKESE